MSRPGLTQTHLAPQMLPAADGVQRGETHDARDGPRDQPLDLDYHRVHHRAAAEFLFDLATGGAADLATHRVEIRR